MAKLHELLAAEKTLTSAMALLLDETRNKFAKVDSYFRGQIKTLKMLEETPANAATEKAAREEKPLTTTVAATMGYLLDHWVKTEDLLYQKNRSNQEARATIELYGAVLVEGVPVDELMGLENRLAELRRLIQTAPTLDASVKWILDQSQGEGVWVSAAAEEGVKTEKRMFPVILSPATDKHPAQVKEASKDEVVGLFSTRKFTGALTTIQKANTLTLLDDLIAEVKKSRIRANGVEANTDRIGGVFARLIMDKLTG